MLQGDTIVAISSSLDAPCACAIVRISGPDAERFAMHVLDPQSCLPEPRSAARVRLVVSPLVLPHVWLYRWITPASYTGEDLVEFHLTGNALLTRLLLDALVSAGARQAEPGEFTARAFFNGKIPDLASAEGVAALVGARSEAEVLAARKLLGGELARRLAPAVEAITETLSLVEAGIDFSDEGIQFIPRERIVAQVAHARGSLDALLLDSTRFERLAHEPRVVLAGRPNAGKSTLLNVLAGHRRAVVSPLAGTTRDLISAHLRLQHGLVRLVDSAGLGEVDGGADSDDRAGQHIESQMRSAALRAIESADVVVLVRAIDDQRPTISLPREPDLRVITKHDLRDTSGGAEISDHAPAALQVSALRGHGLDELRSRLDELAFGASGGASDKIALNARHARAVEQASASLTRARAAVDAGPEFLAFELRGALDALGEVLGHVTPDDVLGRVFESFCIGK